MHDGNAIKLYWIARLKGLWPWIPAAIIVALWRGLTEFSDFVWMCGIYIVIALFFLGAGSIYKNARR